MLLKGKLSVSPDYPPNGPTKLMLFAGFRGPEIERTPGDGSSDSCWCKDTSVYSVKVKILTVLFGIQAVAFLVGYVLQDIKLALFITLGGTALTFVIVTPPWPFFNRHPVKWLSIGSGTTHSTPQNIVIDQKALR